MFIIRKMEQDQVTYHLPPEFAVETPPPAGAISWPEHAVLKVESKVKANDVTVSRAAAYNFTLFLPRTMPNFTTSIRKSPLPISSNSC